MSGYYSKGVPLSSIFAPYVAGTTKARASGILDANNDLSNIYANIIYGTAAAATGIKSESADINTLYAKLGTTNYPLPINGQGFIAHSNGTSGTNMLAQVQVLINSNGSYQVLITGNAPNNTANASGTWLPSGQSASNYEVSFAWSQTSQYPSGPATITNSAGSYQACTTNQSINVNAQVGQLTASDKGSTGTIAINIKNISTGQVSVSSISVDVESAGSG